MHYKTGAHSLPVKKNGRLYITGWHMRKQQMYPGNDYAQALSPFL